MNWNTIKVIIEVVIVLNTIGAVFTVFREKRDIAATWAWLLVLNFFYPLSDFYCTPF